MISIRCTDSLKNVSFIRQAKNGSWYCVLANGTAAAFSHAGISKETEAKIRFEHCKTPREAIAVAYEFGSTLYYYANCTPEDTAESRLYAAAPDMLAALTFVRDLTGNVDHSSGGGENTARLYGGMLMSIKEIAGTAIAKAGGAS